MLTKKLKQFPYPAFLLDFDDRVLEWNDRAERLYPSLCRIGNDMPPDLLDSEGVLIGDRHYSPYFEDSLLILLPDLQDNYERSKKLGVQSKVVYLLTGIIGAYLGGSLILVGLKPEIKDGAIFETNRELVSLLFGSYGVALGSLFISKSESNGQSVSGE